MHEPMQHNTFVQDLIYADLILCDCELCSASWNAEWVQNAAK